MHTHKGSGQTLFLRSLGTGESFTDTANKISINVVSSAAQGAELYISLDGSVCTRGAPTLALPAGVAATPAQTVSVNVTLKNTDSAACGPTQFNLLQQLPNGISGTLSPQQLTLAPGASATISWSLTPALNQLAGDYAATVKVQADAQHAEVSQALSVQVSVNDSTPPLLPPALKAALFSTVVELSWPSASDAESGISSYRILRDGVQIGSSTQQLFTDTSVVSGSSHSYSVHAVNGAQLLSQPLTIKVLIPAPGPVCLYQHVDYGGASLCLGLGGGNLPANWVRQASSLKVAAGYAISLHDVAGESGNRLSFGRDIRSLVPMPFNDKALSWRVTSTVANALPVGSQYRLLARSSQLSATVGGESTSSGAAVVQGSWTGSAAQTWRLESRSDRELRLVNVGSSLCLAPQAGSFAPATAMAQLACDTAFVKYWYARPLGRGYYELINTRSGMCLEVRDASSAAGAALQQNFCTRAQNQHWRFEALP